MLVQYFTPNMEISRTILERRWESPFIDTVQKVATYSIIPIAMIIFLEAVLKNMVFINLANVTVYLINKSIKLYPYLKGCTLERFGY